MPSPVNLLNKLSKTPVRSSQRKRQRDADDQEPLLSKRRAVGRETVKDATPARIEATSAMTSRSRLSRPSLPSPGVSSRRTRSGLNVFEPPASPELERKGEKGKSKEPLDEAAPKPTTKTRKLAQKKPPNASPFKGVKFGNLDEHKSGAVLTSHDSPAKNTRAAKKNPLEKLKGARRLVEEQHQSESVGGRSELVAKGRLLSEELPEEVSMPYRGPDGSVVAAAEDDLAGEAQDQAGQGSRTLPSSARNRHDTQSRQTVSKAPPSHVADEDGENASEDEDMAEEREEAQEASQKSTQTRGGRIGRSQEEKAAKKEADALRRQQNAAETEAARLTAFERHSKRFVEGVEDAADVVGGVDAWAKMGGGAKSITSMVAKKDKLDSETANAVWRHLLDLVDCFKGKKELSDDEVTDRIGTLQQQATKTYLTRDNNAKARNRTVTELFERIIPYSVYVLKYALKDRFHAEYKVSWQELLLLSNIAFAFCDVAMSWTPKPSLLESGIRNHVRIHIKPGLATVRDTIRDHLATLQYQERNRRMLEQLTRQQQMARAKRQKILQDLEVSLGTEGPTVSRWPQRPHANDEAVDIDDEVPEYSNSKGKMPIRPRLWRHATEEIPAPDPVVWRKDEEVALLNGLQTYTGHDRYERILESFVELRGKDIDDCIAQAQYYKQACSEMLTEKAAIGDHSSDWLRYV